MLAVAVMAAGFGSVKAYKAYNISQSEIGLENIEAFSYELPEVTITCGKDEGRCWDRDTEVKWSWKYSAFGKACHYEGYQTYYCTGII